MKILVNNSEMVFRKVTIIEKSYTKTFVQSEVGGQALVSIDLDVPVKPGIPIEVTVTGDSGVVTNNLWNLKYNAASSSSTIVTNGDKKTIESTAMVNRIWLQRDSLAATGSITISVKYAGDRNYEPTVIFNEDVVVDSQHTENTYVLDSPIVAPAVVQFKSVMKSGSTIGYVRFGFLDNSNNEITYGLVSSNGYYNGVKVETSVTIAKVVIGRASGSSTSGTFACEVIVP